jgi:hypothetical protein
VINETGSTKSSFDCSADWLQSTPIKAEGGTGTPKNVQKLLLASNTNLFSSSIKMASRIESTNADILKPPELEALIIGKAGIMVGRVGYLNSD